MFERHEIWIDECDVCRHRFADLAPTQEQLAETYGNEYFEGGGAGYDNYLDEKELLIAAGRRYAGIAARFATPGTVLDVGSAAGFILRGLRDGGWTGSGIEINDRMADYGREQFNLDIFTGDLTSYPDEGQFDLVTMIQVIAHIPDPAAAIRKVNSLTKSGGLLLIETWRRDSITARIFGKNWHEYSPPSVMHWFTKKGLQEMVEAAGYQTIASGRPAKWINAAHAKSLVRYKLAQMPAGTLLAQGLKLIPDKLNLPYPAEDLAWMLFRKTD